MVISAINIALDYVSVKKRIVNGFTELNVSFKSLRLEHRYFSFKARDIAHVLALFAYSIALLDLSFIVTFPLDAWILTLSGFEG